ncbi:MAG: PfkB family carbohydrate kinase [Candidatus Brocadiia bacterium]
MVDVVALGELLIDFVSTHKGLSLAESPGFAKKAGGAPANVAVGLAKLGLRSGFVGKVGNDAFGAFLRDTLSAQGVDVARLAMTSEARTTLAFVALKPDGSPDFAFYRGADALLGKDDIDEAYHREARAFHFGSISLASPEAKAATLKALDIAREADQLVSYDPNYRPALWPSPGAARREILAAFEHAHVAKVSDEEWEFITGTADLEAGSHVVLDRGVKLLVVSRGARGCFFTTGSDSGALPGYQVEVAETTGAGDGFVAALLASLLAAVDGPADLARLPRASLAEACDFANAVGALTATRVGAIPALPTRDEALRFWHRHRG